MASSSSSSSPSVPASSSHPWKYHVFLSFRGEDTRKNFVDHLYTTLIQKGIHTYKDDETLPRGESVGPALEKAIEESQIALIIFSENYANSSWCLGELAYIMKCKDIRGTTVIPIFYGVEPSTVRYQLEKYGEAFSKHGLENEDKVESWRQALVDASNLAGWEPKQIANGHEGKAIKEIVDTISQRLHPLTNSSTNKNLVGIEVRMQDLKAKLEIGSGGVRMIGIWGVGGGGKTTLALSVYTEISNKFDGCCFVENIREESSKHGLEKLQKTIISNVLKKKEVEGRWLPDGRLRRIKVLIVLDDVDHLDHLKKLVGSPDWFGEGSRIIITTRDKHLLNAHRVNVIYNIRLLNYDEAIKLLHKHAPRDNRPTKDYELLSQAVVSYAGGLPLALEVLGCFLCDKDMNEWRSTLAKLKAIPKTDIVKKLKISYDGLEPDEKKLFLDIACFHKGVVKTEVIMAILDACDFHPVVNVKVLIQKALITISHGKFDMHDLVQEMGHDIVRGKHRNNPEKHSRVWKKEDVLKICAMDASEELDMIEAMECGYNWNDEIQLLQPIVAKMGNLRYFYLMGDIASPFPTNFPPLGLRCLILSGISQKQLWNGCKHLRNLKYMQLARLENLSKTPDFNGIPNLERLVLDSCPCLKKIHPSIGRLPKLVFLLVQECSRLKMIPPIAQLKKLETLSFFDCPKLFDKSLRKPFLGRWKRDEREVAKPGEDYHTRLRFFPTCLRYLNLAYCNVGDNDIGSAVWEFPNLEELNLAGNSFTRLNFSVLRLPRLKRLNVTDCKDLLELSELPSSIAIVVANDCSSLKSFGDISNCKWLWKVSLLGENKLDPHEADTLLDFMLQGNALKNHFLSVCLQHHMVLKRFVNSLYMGKTFKLYLPYDWYNEFCGFLICIVSERYCSHINIVIKQQYSPSKIWQESNEALDPKYDETAKFVGYVSFSSLRHTGLLNLSDNVISFSIDLMCYGGPYGGETYIGVELVPRKSKIDEVQATIDSSEFWDKETEDRSTFTIQHDSQSSIKIIWQPIIYKRQAKKLIIKVDVHNEKEKEEALRALDGISGITSKSLDMENKKLTVIGYNLYLGKTIKELRKHWQADFVSEDRV